jgi:DICT domain-containing protein/GAF domain-containing protein
MRASTSLLQALLEAIPDLRPQVYYKASLTALSHAIEDLVIVGKERPLVIANFQQERFYRQDTRRYQRIAQRTDQVYVLAAFESNFVAASTPYVTIPFNPEDDLSQEWHLIIIGEQYSACLVCREHASPVDAASLDQARQFKGIWTFDRQVSLQAAQLMLKQIVTYRPELATKANQALQLYGLNRKPQTTSAILEVDARLFVDRLVTYLQRNQRHQLEDYRTIAAKERKECLINSITAAIRRSLQPEEILDITVRELGTVFHQCRCLLYRYSTDQTPAIAYEAVGTGFPTLPKKVQKQGWSLAEYPPLQTVLRQNQTIAIANVDQDFGLQSAPDLKAQLKRWHISACLLVPIRYQNLWLGMLELHHPQPHLWQPEEVSLVEAIATQAGVALMQAQAYTSLEILNHQLLDLERTQRNLVAIVGHELRTPLSTIQICLESLADKPDIPIALQQTMLETALNDSERLRKLIQDFLTLSRLESNLVRWQLEAISLQESLNLLLSNFTSTRSPETMSQIVLDLPHHLPLIYADEDMLLEVLTSSNCRATGRYHLGNFSRQEPRK